ncbi:hypothetical protein LUZ61_004471 [Rhynchospora tenuis]|uniref:Uncharacterized protein n=1 Tax=Rhynchospora tenuis TaxID=198213 RepID=A0AAD6ETR2_9POAL|nr:hypothetical protein LUZ61_004471 [Rhynchospora tenuis]
MSIIFFLVFLLCCTSAVLSTKDDEKVLLKIKKQLGNPYGLSWWVKGFDYCNASANIAPDYSYITCTNTSRVRSILLQNLDVTAPFPGAICELTEVQDILLSHDPRLYGPIPSCITELPNLWEVIITDTSLSGPVPSFHNSPNLLAINLARNHLSEFSDYLYGFDLRHNKIYGKVPDSFATAAGLWYPNLSYNKLCGELPREGNMWRFSAEVFANNTCLCGKPLPPCSNLAPAPAPAFSPPY